MNYGRRCNREIGYTWRFFDSIDELADLMVLLIFHYYRLVFFFSNLLPVFRMRQYWPVRFARTGKKVLISNVMDGFWLTDTAIYFQLMLFISDLHGINTNRRSAYLFIQIFFMHVLISMCTVPIKCCRHLWFCENNHSSTKKKVSNS